MFFSDINTLLFFLYLWPKSTIFNIKELTGNVSTIQAVCQTATGGLDTRIIIVFQTKKHPALS
jgi:hypothetical protein